MLTVEAFQVLKQNSHDSEEISKVYTVYKENVAASYVASKHPPTFGSAPNSKQLYMRYMSNQNGQ